MIQDIFPHKMHNEYYADATPKENDIIFCFEHTKLWVKTHENMGETIAFCQIRDLKPQYVSGGQLIYLFAIDNLAFYLLDGHFSSCIFRAENGTISADSRCTFSCVEIKELREKKKISQEMAFAAYTAKHLADWYRDNHFCGSCGKLMEHSKRERAMTCPCCGFTSYPRIMPAVIVGVTKADEIIVTRYRTGYRHNALIAGFTEIGETLEETVAREVMEEVGIHVKNIRYYKSQPWGIANDILIGFFCEVDGDTEIHMDEQELKYAQWTKREDIVLQPDHYSLTNEMMEQFKTGAI